VRSSSPGQRCAYVLRVTTAEACPRTVKSDIGWSGKPGHPMSENT
jgi:hypothetical protein